MDRRVLMARVSGRRVPGRPRQSFGLPSRGLVSYHVERGGMPLHDAGCGKL